jgi:hypothetical protein
MHVLPSLDDYDSIFHPAVSIDGTVFYRGRQGNEKPQECAHRRAMELKHSFYVAYNSFYKNSESYAFCSFIDFDHFESFFNRYARHNMRICRFFEQMVGKSKFYLDVDVSPYPSDYTGMELINEIHNAVNRAFVKIFSKEISRSGWRIADSSKMGEKMSYHMTLCGGGRFVNAHTHMFSFFAVVHEEFMSQAPSCMTNYGTVSPIDKSVYTQNRNFRLVNNVKHKSVHRPLIKLDGEENFPDKDYAATACEDEEDLPQNVHFNGPDGGVGARLSTKNQFKSDERIRKNSPSIDPWKTGPKKLKVTEQTLSTTTMFMHGKNVDPFTLILFDYDRVDIESMKGVSGGCFRSCRLVSTFVGNSDKRLKYARPFIVGYSFDFDRSVPCPLCGGMHENNHAWVMYDSHLNRYMKQHSTNCSDSLTLVPFTPRGLILWQDHYEKNVWQTPTAEGKIHIAKLFAIAMKCRLDQITRVWVTETGVAITSAMVADCDRKNPKQYLFFQMDDRCPPHEMHRSERPWSFSDRIRVCTIRHDAFDLFNKSYYEIPSPRS